MRPSRSPRLAALVITLALAAGILTSTITGFRPSSEEAKPEHPATELLPSLELVKAPAPVRTFTPAEIHYLQVLAWQAAEARAFLEHVADLERRYAGSQLRAIAGCESSREHRPWGEPIFDRYFHDDPGSSISTASGFAQALDGTWRSWVATYAPLLAGRWARAAQAPRWAQLAVVVPAFEDIGTSPWRASRGCWG